MPKSEDVEEFARLLDWVEGRLSEQEARAVEEQVAAAGSTTRADVAWLRAFARISEDTVIASPPSRVRDALIERFEAYAEGKQQPGFGLLDIYGQILAVDGTDSGVFGVQLLEGSSEVATTATNDLGEFTFEAVPPGAYEVLAGSDRVEIRLPQVELHRGP